MDVDANVGGKMKLSEYIHSKMGPSNAITWRAHTEEDIDEWIMEWYKKRYARLPPIWLVQGERNE